MSDVSQGPGWWLATDNKWYPPEQSEQTLLIVGDIRVSRSWIVTPLGTCPIADAQIDSVTQTVVYRRTPTWAVIVAFVFILSLVSLLFLFVKEDRTNGTILVTVEGPQFSHTTAVRVYGFPEVDACSSTSSRSRE